MAVLAREVPEPRGMVGAVRMTAAVVGRRTRITDLHWRPPLQVLRAHHLDPIVPDLAYVTVTSPAGGVLGGDRLEVAVHVGPAARLHVSTPSATRLYRMPTVGAELRTQLCVEAGAYLEYLPDPYIPFAGSRFTSRTTVEIADDATLLLWEIVAPGRAARGEILRFDRFESVLEIGRPGEGALAVDAVILDSRERLEAPGLLGGFAAVGTLTVVRRGFGPDAIRGALEALDPARTMAGASSLPADSGAWLRVLAPDTRSVSEALRTAFEAVRRDLLGAPSPPDRRP